MVRLIQRNKPLVKALPRRTQSLTAGGRIRAEILYRETIGPEPLSPEEVAKEYNLPVQAVLEATALAGKRSLRLTAALKLMHRVQVLLYALQLDAIVADLGIADASVDLRVASRRGDECQIDGIQHELDGDEHRQRVRARHHTRGPEREQSRSEKEIRLRRHQRPGHSRSLERFP